ncbi:hypothetical protein X753_31205 [Mesorhizobium sp. LNJC399B00]|uniref:SMP-30/gluconolactonase/LRE family protein n=1 Tax=Mesorhizobium sp. LNJC399B00 TaxID=1287277 RepID=UPI0003CF3DF9|nr:MULTISPECIES: SMP-30/gluconolactonase/LRE family protein [unclassified Mesorhizobium]ESX98400.1 hypothetical protein X753_31205 [Mesorhizobium sp. LNJC399B00]WJI67388.1 SMP-30/gluconolactonase/LRE family protein [Mesorhizobium sp. C399B]
MRLHHARAAFDCHNLLGEGCNWNALDQSLWWTDIEGKCVFRWDDNGKVAAVRQLPSRAAFVFPRARDGFVLGFPKSIVITDPTFTDFSQVAEIEPHLAQTRVNEAAIDPYGGIVLGTYNEQTREPVGGVYRIASNGEVIKLFSGVAAANGLAFSPDGRIMYFTDTTEGTIRRFAVAPQFAGLAEIGPLAARTLPPDRLMVPPWTLKGATGAPGYEAAVSSVSIETATSQIAWICRLWRRPVWHLAAKI